MRDSLRAHALVLLFGGLAACAAPTRSSFPSAPALVAQAQEERGSERRAAEAPEEEKKNSIGVFLGSTVRDGSGEGTIALEYKRRVREGLAVGGAFEWVPDGREEVLVAPALWLYPWRGLFLAVGPGLEFEEGDETSLLFRVGAGWEFELDHGFTLEPEINYDIVDGVENAVVVGVTLGYAF